MTDDLVNRLRSMATQTDNPCTGHPLFTQAADAIARLTSERDAAWEKLSEAQDMIGDEVKLMHRHKFCQNQSMCLPVDHFTDMLGTLERIRALSPSTLNKPE